MSELQIDCWFDPDDKLYADALDHTVRLTTTVGDEEAFVLLDYVRALDLGNFLLDWCARHHQKMEGKP